jgi:hypothetical protein
MFAKLEYVSMALVGRWCCWTSSFSSWNIEILASSQRVLLPTTFVTWTICSVLMSHVKKTYLFFKTLMYFILNVYASISETFNMKTNHVWVRMSSNEPKLMSKHQFFCNFCYICLCDATLMACESWKIVIIEYIDIEKSKMNPKKFQYQILVWIKDV